jgi:cobalt-zinc-cadmium efflux system outer membrane protein
LNRLSRKKPIIARFCLLSILFFPLQHVAWAQAESVDGTPLLLSQAIERSLENHPALSVYAFKREAQAGRVTQAGLPSRATLDFQLQNILGSGELSGMDAAEATLSISWLLDQSHREARTAFESQRAALIDNDQSAMMLDVAAGTSRLFLLALSQQQRIKIADSAVTGAEAMLKAVKRRVEAGRAPQAELFRAQANLAQRQLDKYDFEHDQQSTLRKLAAQWGSRNIDFLPIQGDLFAQPALLDFKSLLQQLKDTPRLRRIDIEERVQQAALAQAKREAKPAWQATAGIRRMEDLNDTAFVAGISVPLGFGNRNQGRIAALKAELAAERAQSQAQQLDMETELYVVYEHLRHNLHLIEALQQDIIPSLASAFRETQKAYDASRYSYVELLAVQTELLDAQASLVDASLAAHLGRIELERLTGASVTSHIQSDDHEHE